MKNYHDFSDLKKKRSTKHQDDLLAEGKDILFKIIKGYLHENSELKHVVPLSGGLDSRLLLGMLIKLGFKNQITTISYGTPGSYDFEIGNLVASYLNSNHISIDLNQYTVTEYDLIQTFKEISNPTDIFSAYYNQLIREHIYEDCLYWSGYMGDPLAGSHYHESYENVSWNEAQKIFMLKNKFSKINLIDNYNIINLLPQAPLISDSSLLTYPEQLDLSIRQPSFVYSIINISPSIITPFAHTDWIAFMLSLPNSLRQNSMYYKMLISLLISFLASLPTKNLNGKPLIGKYSRDEYSLNIKKKVANLNYIKFKDAFRFRDDYTLLAYNACNYLEKHYKHEIRNKILISPMNLFQAHKKGLCNAENALITFISVYIKYLSL